MGATNTSSDNLVVSADVLAIHVMRELSRAQHEGRAISLADLANAIEVRKADVRRVISELDRRGFVDALRMRLTLLGFAVGLAAANETLKPVRRAAPKVGRAPHLRVAA